MYRQSLRKSDIRNQAKSTVEIANNFNPMKGKVSMPYNKVKLAEMTATIEEYIDIDEIARRLEVTKRTVERLTERYAKKLKKSRKRKGRKIQYLWSDILKYAKVYTGLEKENISAIRNKRQDTKERLKEQIGEFKEENKRLKIEVNQLKNEIDTIRREGDVPYNSCDDSLPF